MPAWPVPQSMKMISPPLEECRGGLLQTARTPLKAEAFFPLPRGDFHGRHTCLAGCYIN